MQPSLDVTKENRLFDIFVTENTSKENKCLFFTENRDLLQIPYIHVLPIG